MYIIVDEAANNWHFIRSIKGKRNNVTDKYTMSLQPTIAFTKGIYKLSVSDKSTCVWADYGNNIKGKGILIDTSRGES
jgi:hypothetical protein